MGGGRHTEERMGDGWDIKRDGLMCSLSRSQFLPA